MRKACISRIWHASAVQGLSDAFDALGLAVPGAAHRGPARPGRHRSVAVGGPAVARAEAARPAGHRSPRSSHPCMRSRRRRISVGSRSTSPSSLFARCHARMRSFKIRDDVIYPICTPELAAKLQSPRGPRLLPAPALGHGLGERLGMLAVRRRRDRHHPANNGPAFSLYSLAVQAALEGAGILMAHEAR